MATLLEDGRLGWLTSGNPARAEVDIAALVETHSGLLYRVALSVVHNSAEAEDIVQETFLRAFEQRGRLAGVTELRAWLIRVTWNLALDRHRRITPQQIEASAEAMVASADLPADRQLAAAAELARTFAAIEKLPPPERAALILNAVDELSTAEIATVIRRSESSVRSLLFRARAHLEQRLNRKPPTLRKGTSR